MELVNQRAPASSARVGLVQTQSSITTVVPIGTPMRILDQTEKQVVSS